MGLNPFNYRLVAQMNDYTLRSALAARRGNPLHTLLTLEVQAERDLVAEGYEHPTPARVKDRLDDFFEAWCNV